MATFKRLWYGAALRSGAVQCLLTQRQSSGHLQNSDVVRAVDELLDLITVKFSKISTEVFAKSEQASADKSLHVDGKNEGDVC